jgi:hypothetical protein
VVPLDCSCTMLKQLVMIAGRQRLECQLPLVAEHTHIDPARRRLSPHQCGGLNNKRTVVTEEHAEMM